MCKIAPFASTLSVNASICTLVAISFERYRAILNPFKEKLKIKECFLIIVLIWIISISFSLIKLYNFHVDQFNNVNICFPKNLILNKHETIFLVFFQYILPFILILYAYSRIAIRIYQNDGLFDHSTCTHYNKNKKKAIKMIFIVVILFMVCWAPLQIFNLINVLFPDSS
jgi:leucokinin receptor